METSNDFILINSTFDPSEAREILSHMIESKINFHAINNLNSQERYGHRDEHSIERIKHLRASWVTLREMIDNANKEGQEIRVFSGVRVEIVNQKNQQLPSERSNRFQ